MSINNLSTLSMLILRVSTANEISIYAHLYIYIYIVNLDENQTVLKPLKIGHAFL